MVLCTCRQHATAREEATTALVAAQTQLEEHREYLAQHNAQLGSSREQLHACQLKAQRLEEQLQESQDQAQQLASEMKVTACSECISAEVWLPTCWVPKTKRFVLPCKQWQNGECLQKARLQGIVTENHCDSMLVNRKWFLILGAEAKTERVVFPGKPNKNGSFSGRQQQKGCVT